MIIEAKSSQQQADPADARKRLDFNKPEKATGLPVFLGLLFTGIAAYIRSAFPTEAQDEAPGAMNGNPGGTSGTPRGMRNASGLPGVDTMTTGSIAEEHPSGSIGQSGLPWDDGFTLPDHVSFHYTAQSFDYLGPHVAPFFPAAVNYRPQNDNAPLFDRDVDAPLAPLGRPVEEDDGPPAADGDEDGTDDDEIEEEDEGGDDDDPQPGNRAPTVLGPVRLHDVFAGQVMLIGLSQLLFGASDPDNDILTINDISATGGMLVARGSGWSFETMPGMLGVVTFTYKISDGLIDIVQTASLEIVRNRIMLTPGDDVFAGTPWDDDIDGLGGDDVIDARAGNDIVVGGSGDDHINGGDGDDQLFGNDGDDIIFGGRGNDIIGGGAGNDQLHGEDGDDVIDGDAGDDLLTGGAGDDILRGGEGDDRLEGDEGDDMVYGGAGKDLADGGSGNDIIEGNDGDDELIGGAGDDIIDGGAGDDVLEGNQGNDILIASTGSDVVDGGEGDDRLEGGAGEDTLIGGAGEDLLDGGTDDDTLFGGSENDTLIGGDGDDEIYGEAGDDLIMAGNGDDEVDGGAGDDYIMGDAGYDLIDGGEGHDTLDYSNFTADIHLNFEAGVAWSEEIDEDLFQNIEEVIGGRGNDTFEFGDKTAIITGGDGEDLFIFTVTEETASISQKLVFEILDFVVGDRIHVAEYEISRRAERLEAERFGEIYDALEQGFEAGLPIRVSHAFYDDMDHTIIEADVDRNDFYEISITLDGVSLPLSIGNHVA